MMVTEKQRNLLFIGGLCLAIVLVEEIINEGSLARSFTVLKDTPPPGPQDTLAVDGLTESTRQLKNSASSNLAEEGVYTAASETFPEGVVDSNLKVTVERLTRREEKIGRKRENVKDIFARLRTLKQRQPEADQSESATVDSGSRAGAGDGKTESSVNVDEARETSNSAIGSVASPGLSQTAGEIAEKEVFEPVNQAVSETASRLGSQIGGEDDAEEEERLRRSPFIIDDEVERQKLLNRPKISGMKLISEWQTKGIYRHSFSRCRYNKCRWEPDNSKADGVLFRAAGVRTWIIEPFKRKPGQRWIMYTNDPAIKNYGFERPDVGSNFNATTTYQLHSDYHRPFGKLQRVKPPAKNYEKLFDGKHKQVAWFVSHCQTWSRRELFVERMRKIIPVDVFGACGNMTCGVYHYRGNDSNLCLPMLSQQYKFYLAFENSFCKDYVSEKFFKLFQGVDVIPVVQGGFDYHKYMPSKIFIDSSDFRTPEALAEYLVKLSADKERYVDMLKRKAGWTYRAAEPMHCVVCEKLHTDNSTHYHKDLVAEFNGRPSECYLPPWRREGNPGWNAA